MDRDRQTHWLKMDRQNSQPARQTDRQNQGKRDIWTDRQKEGKRDRWTDRWTDRDTGRPADVNRRTFQWTNQLTE